MQRRDIIIFVQAPADITYMLKLYEDNVNKRNIDIIVVNVKNIYKYINTLNLKVKSIVFIKNISATLKKPWTYIHEYYRIRKLWRTYYSGIIKTDIYFFSVVFDSLTSFLVSNLSKKTSNNVFYADHYDMLDKRERLKKLSFKTKINRKLLTWLTGDVTYDFSYNYKGMYSMDYQKFKISRIEAIEIQNTEKYQYKLPLTNKKNILFLVDPWVYDNKEIEMSCLTETVGFIKAMQDNGLTVLVKGHPRLGIQQAIAKAANFVIPEYIPSEFLCINGIYKIIGVDTSGIRYYIDHCDVPVYTIVKLYNAASKVSQKMIVDYLNNLTNGKILFAKSINDII